MTYQEQQTSCDLCNVEYNHHKEGLTTECGTSCCDSCSEDYVKFIHTGDEVFAFLED
jgi:hypothetical protein